jgi:DNA-binding beta-propeller fold protein YncE
MNQNFFPAKMKISAGFTVLVAAVALFTTGPALRAQQIKTEGDVTVILNPKKAKPPKDTPTNLILTENWLVGDSLVEEEMVAQAADLAVDDSDNLYVLDIKSHNIKVFDPDGKYVRTIGKQGQGPGELNTPTGLQILPDGTLLVNDSLNRRLAYFKPDGTFINNRSIADRTSLITLIADKKGSFLGRELIIEDNKLFWEVRKFDQDLKTLFTIERIPFPNPLTDKINVFEQLFFFLFDNKGNIIFSNPKDYAIRVYTTEGTLFKRIEKKYDPREVTDEEKEEILQRIPSTGIDIKERLVFPKNFPAYETFTIDEEGRLIVRTNNKGKNEEENMVDVFDPEGRLITSFSSKISPRIWKNGRLYSSEENEDGINIIKCYSYRWEK